MNEKTIKMLLVAIVVAMTICTGLIAEEQKAKLSKEDEKKYELTFEAALAHNEKAKLLYEDKKIDEAIKELEAIIKLEFPKGAEDRDGRRLQLYSYGFLAELLLGKKQYDKTVETLKAGLKLAPELGEETYQLYMTLGHTYKEMKKTNDALKAFEKAQKINEALRKLKEAEEKENKPAKDQTK